jgi:hypothetical protein
VDAIFEKTHSIFSVVGIAKEEPYRYGKDGELLINYEEIEQARRASGVWGREACHGGCRGCKSKCPFR